jgi:hypothetical protein
MPWGLLFLAASRYSGCRKYVAIDLANLLKVIASGAKQSRMFSKRLLRRQAPRNDCVSEQVFDNRYNKRKCKV